MKHAKLRVFLEFLVRDNFKIYHSRKQYRTIEKYYILKNEFLPAFSESRIHSADPPPFFKDKFEAHARKKKKQIKYYFLRRVHEDRRPLTKNILIIFFSLFNYLMSHGKNKFYYFSQNHLRQRKFS